LIGRRDGALIASVGFDYSKSRALTCLGVKANHLQALVNAAAGPFHRGRAVMEIRQVGALVADEPMPSPVEP
jgi:hypothetical protein